MTDSGFCSYTNPSRATIPLIRPHQCDSEGGRIRGVLLYSEISVLLGLFWDDFPIIVFPSETWTHPPGHTFSIFLLCILSYRSFTVTCCLTVGHGRSEGVRVDISKFTDYTNDVIQHVDMVKGKYPDCPVFLFGYSMVSSDLV